MNDRDLDRLLKTAQVPERAADYWEEFPVGVIRALRQREDVKQSRRQRFAPFRPVLALGAGLAVVCLAICLGIGFWKGSRGAGARTASIGHSPDQDQSPLEGGSVVGVAEAQKLYREIIQLFPNQVREIIFDQNGPHLLLADRADVPSFSPLFVRICGPKECQHIVTFSGQQIRINGETVDVLVGPKDEIILAGAAALWSSTRAESRLGSYQIQAEPLETRL